jgi:hypothetical protein
MSFTFRLRHWCNAGMLLALALCGANAAAIDITPSGDLRAAIAALRPGDELVLVGGTYTMSSRFGHHRRRHAAAADHDSAKTGEKPRIHMTTNQQNVIEIQGSRYLTFRGIEVTGGSHGIRLMDSDFVTIESCEVHETGDVAISANSGGTYEGLRILRNHIHHTHGTGEGLYLGCNDNGCQVANSLIEGNYIHHTNGRTWSRATASRSRKAATATRSRQRHSRHELSGHHHLQHRRQRSGERAGRQRHLEQQRQLDPVCCGRGHP